MGATYNLFCIKDQSVTKNNVYLIVDKETNRTTIIDPACSQKQINELVASLGLIVDTILVTHTHSDHTRCIDELVNQYSCNVYVSRIEANYYSYHCKNIHLFEDNAVIRVGKTWFRCLLTPGHTVGSTCFLLENSLFTGDTVFMEGCGLCTEKGGSASSMFYSIERLKQQVDDSVLVYSGHTYSIQPGQSMYFLKQNNIYFVLEEEKQFIEFRMRKNQKNLFDFS